ncbi:hypothetical protein TNCV_1588871 [Trichonephila clavipes]|uniref:Uncharacterized protein n=1 Tax=Trichonephila clavipes TaxID=2585209 RepID=A0A8X6RFJ0_TRICX|nr:hypothetical protein TNCV_1588871 [Trichonephila clavipes]
MDTTSCTLARNYSHVYPVSVSLNLQENHLDYQREIVSSESWNYEFHPSDCLYAEYFKKPAASHKLYSCTVQDGRTALLLQVLSFHEKCPPFQYFKTDLLISVFRDEPNMFPKCRRMHVLQGVPATMHQNAWFTHDSAPAHFLMPEGNHLRTTYPGSGLDEVDLLLGLHAPRTSIILITSSGTT